MNTKINAWAIQRPDGRLLSSMIRATRQAAIRAIADHIGRHESNNPWQMLRRRGFRAVLVTIEAEEKATKKARRGPF